VIRPSKFWSTRRRIIAIEPTGAIAEMSSQPIPNPSRPPRPQPEPARPSCRVILPGTEFRLPLDVFTLEGFRAWATSEDSPEKAKVTFLNGQVTIDMSGEEVQASTLVKTAVCVPLGQIVLEEDLGIFSIDSALVSNVPADVSNIPDAALVTWDSLEAGRARLVQNPEHPERYWEIEGTPDWVLEIVSDSSVGKDTRDLLTAYHRAGIREYWLIDARGEEIRFTIFLHQPGRLRGRPAAGRLAAVPGVQPPFPPGAQPGPDGAVALRPGGPAGTLALSQSRRIHPTIGRNPGRPRSRRDGSPGNVSARVSRPAGRCRR
jgi:hypothetical protein